MFTTFLNWIKSLFNMNNHVFDNHFMVEWGGSRTDFTEVHGLGFEREIIEIRNGSSPTQIAQKVPGTEDYHQIILRRHLMEGDLEMYQWWKQQSATPEYRDVTINLLNRNHEPIFAWRLRNAFPSTVNYTPLTAGSASVMLEEVELSFESMVLTAD